MMKKRTVFLLVFLVMFVIAACVPDSAETVVFGDAGWDSMQFHNAVAMLVAQHAYGYQTEQVSGTTAVTYNALKKGDIHVYMETWQDNIAPYEEDVSSGAVLALGVNYSDNVQGLYVPRYVIEGDPARGIEPMAPDLRTVADLKAYSAVFADPDQPDKGRLYGAISGWEVDKIMRNKHAFYGLDENYTYMDPGSDAALAAAIAGAYEKGEPIVAYYWEPAWITGLYDLILLEEAPYAADCYLDGACAFPSIDLTVTVNPAFYESHSAFADEFLSQYQTSSALTSQALAHMHETDSSYEEAAVWFLQGHRDLVDTWLPAERAERVHRWLDQNPGA